jgi:hypothetical protein
LSLRRNCPLLHRERSLLEFDGMNLCAHPIELSLLVAQRAERKPKGQHHDRGQYRERKYQMLTIARYDAM